VDSDRRLVKKAQYGRIHALRKLADKYKNEILLLAFDLLGDYNQAQIAARDALQAVLENIKDINPTDSFDSLLYRATINSCLICDKVHKRNSSTIIETESPLRKLKIKDTTKERSANDRTDANLIGQPEVDNKLTLLSTEQRLVIILRYFHKKSIYQIAQILQSSEKFVRNQIYQGMQILEPLFKNKKS
jgi:RNA polymerase sigma-70 factor (ECF subfamily)